MSDAIATPASAPYLVIHTLMTADFAIKGCWHCTGHAPSKRLAHLVALALVLHMDAAELAAAWNADDDDDAWAWTRDGAALLGFDRAALSTLCCDASGGELQNVLSHLRYHVGLAAHHAHEAQNRPRSQALNIRRVRRLQTRGTTEYVEARRSVMRQSAVRSMSPEDFRDWYERNAPDPSDVPLRPSVPTPFDGTAPTPREPER